MSTPASGAPGELFEIEITVQSSVIPSVFESGSCEKFKPSADGHSQRSVLFFVPESIQGKQNVPLLIAFHGSTENGSIFRSRTTAMAYDKLAAEMGFIVAYPSGYKGNWNE
jgi:polyhydroxybutyrate depolymerase